ncbi:hypothetical protein VTG60DRAFT_1923 [Thermothelomyces hinnuleus]
MALKAWEERRGGMEAEEEEVVVVVEEDRDEMVDKAAERAAEKAVYCAESSEGSILPKSQFFYDRMVEAGADVTILDPDGYSTALDHTVFSGNAESEAVFGRLPRSRDGLVRTFQLEKSGEENELGVLIFFSYRWLNQDRSLNRPDAKPNNPTVEADKLCIWMDVACVEQDNPGTGVSALPLMITQCDAMISLVDEKVPFDGFEDMHAGPPALNAAAAGSTEMGGYQASATREWTLEKARDLVIKMNNKKLTHEQDRPKVTFLERQS